MNDADPTELDAEPASEREQRVLRWSLCAAGLIGLATCALTCARRVGYAYPLEWMEGASLQHALWLARGALPYAAPSAELIAYLYPPLAYLPWAAALALLGPSLPVARAISLACTLGALLLIARAGTRLVLRPDDSERISRPIWRRPRGTTSDTISDHNHPVGELGAARSAGLFAAGTFAAGFGYAGAFLDLVRVDACFVLLLVAAAERLSAEKHAAALGWLAAAALAKQHGLPLFAIVALALLARDLRAHARAVIGSALALGAALLGLQLASDGWFARYVFELPSQHGLELELLASFALVDLLLYLPALTIGGAYLLIARWRTRGTTSAWRALTPLEALLLGAVAVSALGRAHPGGDDNVRLPAFALLCICAAAPLAGRVLHGRERTLRRGLCLALLAQLALLWQPPSAHAPHASSERAWRTLTSALQRCGDGGRAVALDYALLTGEPFVHTMALSDLRMGTNSELAARGTRALLGALASKDAPAAIAVGASFAELDRALAQRYRPCTVVRAPRLATGYQPGRMDGGFRVQVVYTRASR